MSGLFSSLSGGLIWLLKAMLLISLVVFGFIFLLLIVNYIYMRFVEKDNYISIIPKHPIFRIKNKNIFYNFFIAWPRQILKNNANPDRNLNFPFGTWSWIGRKGSGKTMGMVRMSKMLLEMFPDMEIAGNVTITDPELLDKYTYCSNIKDLFNVKNSKNKKLEDGGEIIYPMLKLVDEVSLSIKSNRFGGKKNEEVDDELLGAIANQRKEKELYLYTVQRFHRSNKKLREQVDKVYKCFNIGGWMWCLPYILVDSKDQENTVDLKRVKGAFNYVQSQELRDAYDTRQLVKDMVEGGLKSSNNDDDDNLSK